MKRTRFRHHFTLIPSVNHMPPMRYMCYDDILQIQKSWNWHTIDRAGREPRDVSAKCVNGFALTYPFFSLSPLCHQRLHLRDEWWLGRGVPHGAQGSVKVLPGALPQRSPKAFSVWACPQLQIHDHLSLRSKSSRVPHIRKSKQNSQGLLILVELLLMREKFC